TPTAAARHDAALTSATVQQRQDTFTITVSDAHGGTATATATATVTPKNVNPTATPAVGAPNTAGVVNGTVGAADAEGDTLTYNVTAKPTKGTVTVNPDGTFTYVPTAAAQHAASADKATTAQKQDTFAVTVDDAHGGTVSVTITTPIKPKNTSPAAAPTATNPSPTTGAVSGSVGGSDSDNDRLSYAVTTAPTKGTVKLNNNGTFTYTPSKSALAAASSPTATPAQKQDTFSVAVSDGHGGTTLITYTVPLIANGTVVIVVSPATPVVT
ncbi:MAG: cadherin-like domain-containing protein, partial [Actinomycetota bacterium]|nr:cadherin-like domain-containing protein [Actinomycetota bacterium]